MTVQQLQRARVARSQARHRLVHQLVQMEIHHLRGGAGTSAVQRQLAARMRELRGRERRARAAERRGPPPLVAGLAIGSLVAACAWIAFVLGHA